MGEGFAKELRDALYLVGAQLLTEQLELVRSVSESEAEALLSLPTGRLDTLRISGAGPEHWVVPDSSGRKHIRYRVAAIRHWIDENTE